MRARGAAAGQAALAGVGEQFSRLEAPARAAQAFADRGRLLEQLGDLDAAVSAYRQALDADGVG